MVTLEQIMAAFPGLTPENRDDGEIAAALSVGRTASVPVPRSVFAGWCGSTGLRAVIQDKAEAVGDPLRSSALSLLDFLQGGVAPGLDLSHAGNAAMLAAWVSLGAVSAEQRDELLALCMAPDPVTPQQVAAALEGAM
jgi:hypothetical protein